MKYVLFHHLHLCTEEELKDQIKYHSKPYQQWEKDRIKHIKKMLKDLKKSKDDTRTI